MTPSESLRDRKRRETRERIVDAAFALFADRGFDQVTVEDIAESAAVGRTTFFRYFGDKQEVVFAGQSETMAMLDTDDDGGPRLRDLASALAESRRLLASLSGETGADADHFTVYYALVEQSPELADRHRRKLAHYTDVLERHLLVRGTPRPSAMLAAQVALGCYQVAWRLADGDAHALGREADAAFAALLDARHAHDDAR